MNNTKPTKTIERQSGEATARKFSSFDDLALWAVEVGRAGSVEEIRERRPDLWGDLVFEWYTQGQIACIFAVVLAKAADKTAWYNAVLEGPWNAEMVTDIVDAAAISGAEAIQILFPGRGDADQAVAILTELCGHERWLCADVGALDNEQACGSQQVGLRWIAPDRAYESWALGLGDFDPMAFTRRFKGAPFIALVLRPTPPVEGRAPQVIGEVGLPASHLAHLDDGLGSDQEKRDKWTKGTRTAKRRLISPDPLSRARAKVTFAFTPESYSVLAQRARIKPR